MISTTCEFKVNTPSRGDPCGEPATHFSAARIAYCQDHMQKAAAHSLCANINHEYWLPARCGGPAAGMDVKGDWMCDVHLDAALKRQIAYHAWLAKRDDAKREYAQRQVYKEGTQLICDELRRSFDLAAIANDDGTVTVVGAKLLATLEQQVS